MFQPSYALGFFVSQNHEVLREKPNTLQDLKSAFLVAVVAAESVVQVWETCSQR